MYMIVDDKTLIEKDHFMFDEWRSEKNEHSTSSNPSPRRRTLLSVAQDKQLWGSSDRGRNDIELDSLADEEEGDQQDDKDKGADDEEEEPDTDSIKTNTPLPRSTKKKVSIYHHPRCQALI